MSAAAAIAAKDWREFVRDRRLLVAAILTIALALGAVLVSATRVAAYEADRVAAETRDRATWESQGARNPHGAAHFSSWAFRPLTAGALLDPGVTPFAGNAIWMEAHQQNTPRNRPSDDVGGSFEVASLSAAWILQTIVPLLLFVVSAGLVARERERGTLRLLLASGASARTLVPAKLRSTAAIALLLTVPPLLAAIAAALMSGVADGLRIGGWVLAYVLYFAIVSGIAVAVSARARTVAQALLMLVALWLLAVVVAPRAGAGLAEVLAPVPSADAFFTAIGKDLEKAPDVFGKDADAFGAVMAKKYGVADKASLPVSFPGLQLDEDERIGNIAFDKNFGDVGQTYEVQRAWLRVANVLSPLPALQNISMALAGTDTAHQVDFQRQAEAHRRLTVGQLNRDMIEKAAKTDFEYKAGPDLWQRVPAFAYRAPPLARVAETIWIDVAVLALWLAATALLLRAVTTRLGREAL